MSGTLLPHRSFPMWGGILKAGEGYGVALPIGSSKSAAIGVENSAAAGTARELAHHVAPRPSFADTVLGRAVPASLEPFHGVARDRRLAGHDGIDGRSGQNSISR
jgi:hypothetical protein